MGAFRVYYLTPSVKEILTNDPLSFFIARVKVGEDVVLAVHACKNNIPPN